MRFSSRQGQSFSEACPSGYTALGGTVEWYNKDGQLVGTSAGTVVGTSTVMFGPAPAGTTTAVTRAQLPAAYYHNDGRTHDNFKHNDHDGRAEHHNRA
jgi:hypothetical protein